MEPLKKFLTGSQFTQNFVDFFKDETRFERMGRLSGFTLRNDGLITPHAFVRLLVFAGKETMSSSLSEMVAELSEYLNKYVADSSLHERFNSGAVNLMKRVMEDALNKQLSLCQPPERSWKFNRILIRDSTSWQLDPSLGDIFPGSGGGASKAGVKLYYNYDWLGGVMEEFSFHPFNKNDASFLLPELKPKDLVLQDLGFWRLPEFRRIDEQGAYFLSRLKYSIALYTKDLNGEFKKFCIHKLKRNMKVGERWEIEVWVGEKERIPCRLIVERLPQKIADERRRKLKQDKQNKRKNISQGRLEFCDVLAFITNAPAEMLPKDGVIELYGIRWQIEITFKSWKSNLDIDLKRKVKPERFICQLYASMTFIILITNIFQQFRQFCLTKWGLELSELKAIKILVKQICKWGELIRKGSTKKNLLKVLNKKLMKILTILKNTCGKEIKKGRASPFILALKWVWKKEIPMNKTLATMLLSENQCIR
jgi:hypothetical protein